MSIFFEKMFGKKGEPLVVNQFDRVLLKDGRIAHIFNMNKPGVTYGAEIYSPDREFVVENLKHSKIAGVLPKPEYTDVQKKALIACCALMLPNFRICATTVFEVPEEVVLDNSLCTPEGVRETLSNFWGIHDGEEALRVMDYLSKAEGHTKVANEIYSEYISKGISEPLNADTFDISTGYPQNMESATKRAQEYLPAFMEENPMLSEHEDEYLRIFTKSFYVNRVNQGITGYKSALEYLYRFGVSQDEMRKISNFAAWDYGRCGYIGRLAAHAGYIQETEAWDYMITAVNNAAKDYRNWREYLIAYFIGRFVAYSERDVDLFDYAIDFLLNNECSFFKRLPLK